MQVFPRQAPDQCRRRKCSGGDVRLRWAGRPAVGGRLGRGLARIRRHSEGDRHRGERRGRGAATAPDLPVPVEVGDATRLITVKASGSYATVTVWAKESSGWKAQFSASAGRVGPTA
ncbi:hypothetical protein [Streptomyces dysideae]|uniref:hypothetical protein n=1 Tax=Streptomyces dysideae TaxID=909626 RepID=UPI000A45DE8A|nr:hypothetical protein [Streptomyces dysideae]